MLNTGGTDSFSTQISFCLPAYNVEKYVGECIDSILSQKIDNFEFEILCIDDCSVDGTYDELIKFASTNEKIHVLKNSKNLGVSATRNRLIDEANGKYIWFVDPDDLLYPDTVVDFWEIANRYNAEVVLGNYIRFCNIEDVKSQVTNKDFHIEQKDFLPYDDEGTRMCTVCTGVFLKEFLIKNKIYFQEGMIAQEDTLFYYEFSLKGKTIIKCDFPCYLYRQRPTSIMHMRSEERAKKYYESMMIMYKVYKQHLDKGDYDDEKVLKEKIHHSQQNIAFFLAMLMEHSYVHMEIKRLKREGIYPFPFRNAALHTNESFLRRICN